MTQPLVSIITPSFNSARFIRQTIDSIAAQTYTNLEMIIVDDRSTDDSIDVIERAMSDHKDLKMTLLINQENRGAGFSRNRAIENASGRYIAFCDSDDQWKPEKIEKQVQFMMEKGIDLSYTAYDVIDENGAYLRTIKVKSKVSYSTMLKNDYIGCLTAMYDTDKLGKMYMPAIRKRQDWALWLSILKQIDWAYGIHEPLAIYRNRSGSISSGKIGLLKFNYQIYRIVEGFSSLRSSLLMIRFLFYYTLTKLQK